MITCNDNGKLYVRDIEALRRKINSCNFKHLKDIDESDESIQKIIKKYKNSCDEIRIIKKLHYFYRMYFDSFDQLKTELNKRIKYVNNIDELVNWKYI